MDRAEKQKRSLAYKALSSSHPEKTTTTTKTTKEAKAAKARVKEQLDREAVPKVDRCRLVELRPTAQQHRFFLQWFKDSRRTYNLAMARVLREKWHSNLGVSLAAVEKTLQSTLVAAAGLAQRKSKKDVVLLRTPKVLRQQSVKAVIAVLKAHRTRSAKRAAARLHQPANKKLQKPLRFQPGFKAKAMHHDSVCLEKKSFGYVGPSTCSLFKNLQPKRALAQTKAVAAACAAAGLRPQARDQDPKDKGYLFRKVRTKGATALVDWENKGMAHDFKLHLAYGTFFLIVPETQTVASRVRSRAPLADFDTVAAVDPGVRKFATVYSPEGRVTVYGTNTTQVLDKQLRRIDRRKAALARAGAKLARRKPLVEATHRTFVAAVATRPTLRGGLPCTDATARGAKAKLRSEVRRAKRRYHASLRKAKRVVRNFHYNVAHALLQQHETVILPTNTSHHWRKGKRLAKLVKRRATLLQMGQFGERLVQTATWYPESRVLRGSEAYTSKQCGRCGTLNDKLGGSEVFTCRAEGCGAQGDRDVHAARNILLRFLE